MCRHFSMTSDIFSFSAQSPTLYGATYSHNSQFPNQRNILGWRGGCVFRSILVWRIVASNSPMPLCSPESEWLSYKWDYFLFWEWLLGKHHSKGPNDITIALWAFGLHERSSTLIKCELAPPHCVSFSLIYRSNKQAQLASPKRRCQLLVTSK